VLLLIALLTTGCRTVHTLRRDAALRPATRVLLMPLDVELSRVTAAGLLEPRAAWSEAARAHLRAALEESLAGRGAQLVDYQPPWGDRERARDHDHALQLHAAITESILIHKLGLSYQPQLARSVELARSHALPTLRGRFEFTLGPDAAVLAEDRPADCALFVHVRDSYTSPGRGAVVAALALTGEGGGHLTGLASLVELASGDVLWFSHLDSARGDLREAAPAREVVRALLRGLPL
jgi:hypothetical protein